MLGVALYVRAHGLRVGMGLAVKCEPAASPTAMTVAVVGDSDTRWGAAAVVADLATHGELVVVYGSDAPTRPGRDRIVLLTGLRERLPRHQVVALRVQTGSDTALISDFVDSGAVTVAVTPTVHVGDVAARLSTHLRADRVLRVTYSLADGADVYPVWDRRANRPPSVLPTARVGTRGCRGCPIYRRSSIISACRP